MEDYLYRILMEIKGMDKKIFEEELISDEEFVDEDRKDIRHREYEESSSSEGSYFDDKMEIDVEQ